MISNKKGSWMQNEYLLSGQENGHYQPTSEGTYIHSYIWWKKKKKMQVSMFVQMKCFFLYANNIPLESPLL